MSHYLIPKPYIDESDQPKLRIRPFDAPPTVQDRSGIDVVHPPYDRLVLAAAPLLEQASVFTPINPSLLFHVVRVKAMKSYEYEQWVGEEHPRWIRRVTFKTVLYVPVYHAFQLRPVFDRTTGRKVYVAWPYSYSTARVYFYRAIRTSLRTAAAEARKLFYQLNDTGGSNFLLYDNGSRPLVVIEGGKGAQREAHGMAEALWKTIAALYPNVAALAEMSA